jgi:hypothetical protein
MGCLLRPRPSWYRLPARPTIPIPLKSAFTKVYSGTAQRIPPPLKVLRGAHLFRISPPLAGRLRLGAAAFPCRGIEATRHASAERRVRPVRRVVDRAMHHRVEMRVVPCAAKSCSSRIVCSQYRRCQMPGSPRRVMTGDLGSPLGKGFAKAILMARQRPGKSASPWRRLAYQPCGLLIGRVPGTGTGSGSWQARYTDARRVPFVRHRACRVRRRRLLEAPGEGFKPNVKNVTEPGWLCRFTACGQQPPSSNLKQPKRDHISQLPRLWCA